MFLENISTAQKRSFPQTILSVNVSKSACSEAHQNRRLDTRFDTYNNPIFPMFPTEIPENIRKRVKRKWIRIIHRSEAATQRCSQEKMF